MTDGTPGEEIATRISHVAPVMTPVLRPLEAEDAEALGRLFDRLSPTTRYLRFFSIAPHPTPRALHHLASVDHHRREALAAVVDGEIIGVARYDRLREDPDRAEMAVVVEDEWQGHGVGARLMARLTQRAVAEGVKYFTASVLGENHRMLAIMTHLAPERHASIDHGVWELEVPLLAS